MAGLPFFYFINSLPLTQTSPTVTAALTHLLQERRNGRKSTQEWRSGWGGGARWLPEAE